MEIDKIVPGHGNIGGKELLSIMIKYIEDLEEEVGKLKDNKVSLKELKSNVIIDPYKDWWLGNFYPMNLEYLYMLQDIPTSSESVAFANDTATLLKYTTGIREIFEDSKGNIWIGSGKEGVCLYDGSTFTYFSQEDGLSHNQVRAVYEDENGLIWFECGHGLSNYDGEKITTVTSRYYESKNNWQESENDLWFKGDETYGYNELEQEPGLYRYHNGELTFLTFPVPPHKDAHEMYSVTTKTIKGKDGTNWFGTYECAIGYDGNSFNIIGRKEMGLQDDPRHMNIRALHEDSKGNLWIGCNGNGVFIFNGEIVINFSKLHQLRKEDTDGNSIDRVFAIAEDIDGNIWIGAYKSGVWRFDGHSLKNFTKKDGMPLENIDVIYKTKNGELLFGGDNPSGVYGFNGSSFERIY